MALHGEKVARALGREGTQCGRALGRLALSQEGTQSGGHLVAWALGRRALSRSVTENSSTHNRLSLQILIFCVGHFFRYEPDVAAITPQSTTLLYIHFTSLANLILSSVKFRQNISKLALNLV